MCENLTNEALMEGYPIHKIVILKNLSSTFTFASDLEPDICNLVDLPFIIPREQEEQGKLAGVYFKHLMSAALSNFSIILMNYNYILGKTLEALREMPEKPNAADWLFLSFFHSDSELTEANKVAKADLLGIKFKEIESMLDFPFIKKIEIPYRYQITYQNLWKILEDIPVENVIKTPI